MQTFCTYCVVLESGLHRIFRTHRKHTAFVHVQPAVLQTKHFFSASVYFLCFTLKLCSEGNESIIKVLTLNRQKCASSKEELMKQCRVLRKRHTRLLIGSLNNSVWSKCVYYTSSICRFHAFLLYYVCLSEQLKLGSLCIMPCFKHSRPAVSLK